MAATGRLPAAASQPAQGAGKPTATEGLPSYVYRLAQARPTNATKFGTLQIANEDAFPALADTQSALALMRIAPGGEREAHWHTNCWEIQYVLSGTIDLGIVLSNKAQTTLHLGAGDLGFIPLGAGHYARNTGDHEAVVLLAFDTNSIQTVSVASWFAGTPTGDFARTLQVPAAELRSQPKPIGNFYFTRAGTQPKIANTIFTPAGSQEPGPSLPETDEQLSFDLASAPPEEEVEGGGAIRRCNAAVLPALAGNGATVLHVELERGALREPHWHPQTWEAAYFVAGRGEVGVQLPGGDFQKNEVKAGDIAIVPEGAGHFIRNTGNSRMTFVSTFGSDEPGEIGLAAMFGGMPANDFARSLGVSEATLAGAPRPSRGSFIVPG